MKERKIARRLKAEAETHTPDVRPAVLATAEAQNILPRAEKKTRSRGRWMSIAATCMCLALLVPVVAFVVPMLTTSSETTICMQINPALELTVKDDVVVAMRPLNEDAVILLTDTDLVGMNAEEACAKFADMATEAGLMTDNGIKLFISGGREGKIAKKIEDKLTERNHKFHRAAEEFKAEAEALAKEFDISNGKARLVAEVQAKLATLTEAELAELLEDAELADATAATLTKLRDKDLYELLEEYREEAMEAFKNEHKQKFDAAYDEYVAEITALLGEYLQDLAVLGLELSTDMQANMEAFRAFNEKYGKLGEDFLIEPGANWTEIYAELTEELAEIQADLMGNADDAFADLYADWLDDFRHGRFEDHKGGHHGGHDDDHDDFDDDRVPPQGGNEFGGEPPRGEEPTAEGGGHGPEGGNSPANTDVSTDTSESVPA